MAVTDQKRLYEGIYILNASLSEDALGNALEKIKQGIVAKGGVIEQVHDMGRKKLAYSIEQHRQGRYFLLYFTLAPSMLVKIEKDYVLHEDLVRHMIIKAEKVLETLEFKSLVENEKNHEQK